MDADAEVRQYDDLVVIDDEPEILPGDEPEIVLEDGPEILDLTTAMASPPAWRASRPRDGIPLHRFLDRVKLSLAEAASLSSLFLEAVAAMHESGCGHGALDSRSVRIVPDGTVRLAEWGPDTEFPVGLNDEIRRADIRAAAAIIEEITKCAGRPARALTETEDRLLARLTSASDPGSLRRRGARRAGRGLEIAVGRAEQREAARQRLIALIKAVAGYDTVAAASPVGRSGSGGGTPATPPPRRLPPPARRPPLAPRLWKPLAIVAAALVIIGVEIHLFGDDVKRNVKTLLSGDGNAASAGPARPAPLPDLGPPAAGPITHLELRPLDGCRPEATCNAVVQVAVAPHDVPIDVAWRFDVLDRCGSLREERPGGVLTVPPGKDRAVQTVSVAVPAGRALTLVPIATAPARVAGTPMPLFPPDRTC